MERTLKLPASVTVTGKTDNDAAEARPKDGIMTRILAPVAAAISSISEQLEESLERINVSKNQAARDAMEAKSESKPKAQRAVVDDVKKKVTSSTNELIRLVVILAAVTLAPMVTFIREKMPMIQGFFADLGNLIHNPASIFKPITSFVERIGNKTHQAINKIIDGGTKLVASIFSTIDYVMSAAKTEMLRMAAGIVESILGPQSLVRKALELVTGKKKADAIAAAPGNAYQTSKGQTEAKGAALNRAAGPGGSPIVAAVDAVTTPTGRASVAKGLKLMNPTDTIAKVLLDAAGRVGVDPGIVFAIAKQESGFNPSAQASTSSAGGLFQFINSTWQLMVKKYAAKYPELKRGRFDPVAAAIAGALFIKENMAILVAKGIDPTPTNIYASHFLGPGGAVKLLSAPASTVAASLLPKPAAANRNIFYDKKGNPRSVQEVVQVLYEKVGRYADSYRASYGGGATARPPTAPVIRPKPRPRVAGGGSPTVVSQPSGGGSSVGRGGGGRSGGTDQVIAGYRARMGAT
jgi:soluble lytic murein transglycosylase-like protein